MSVPIVNYFSEDAPGKGLKASVEDEKMNLLRLIATHGSEGQKIYKEAQRRVSGKETESKLAVVGSVKVPESLIKEVGAEFDRTLTIFDEIMEQQAAQTQAANVRRQSINAIYKDNVAGDQSILERTSQEGIDDYLAAQAARKAGGGGGGTGSSGMQQFTGATPTLPADYLAHDPSRVQGYDPKYYGDTGTAAPPVSIGQSVGTLVSPVPASISDSLERLDKTGVSDPAKRGKSGAGGGNYRQ